jgi:phosphoglycolate phosphatase
MHDKKDYGRTRVYTAILFDLDGTLTDPRAGILNSVRYALEQVGFSAPPSEEIEWIIGPPLRDSFATIAGISLSDKRVEQLMDWYRKRFGPIGVYENQLFPDIPPVLKDIRTRNISCFVATSKPTVYAAKIIEHFQLKHYFTEILGSELDGSRENKRDIIGELLQRHHLKPDATLMIGDREYDILGAGANGMDSVGVLYGFGSEQELTSAGATHIARTPTDILKFIN